MSRWGLAEVLCVRVRASACMPCGCTVNGLEVGQSLFGCSLEALDLSLAAHDPVCEFAACGAFNPCILIEFNAQDTGGYGQDIVGFGCAVYT